MAAASLLRPSAEPLSMDSGGGGGIASPAEGENSIMFDVLVIILIFGLLR